HISVPVPITHLLNPYQHHIYVHPSMSPQLPHPLSPVSSLYNDPPTTYIFSLSLHDALPISVSFVHIRFHYIVFFHDMQSTASIRSEEHTSELQSRFDLVCRLLLEKKN